MKKTDKYRLPRGDVIIDAVVAANAAIDAVLTENGGLATAAEIISMVAVLEDTMRRKVAEAERGPSEMDMLFAMFGDKLK